LTVLSRLLARLGPARAIALVSIAAAVALVVPGLAGAQSAPVIAPAIAGLQGLAWNQHVGFTMSSASDATGYGLYQAPLPSGSCAAAPEDASPDAATLVDSTSDPLVRSLVDGTHLTSGNWCYWVESTGGSGPEDSAPVEITYDDAAPAAPANLALTGSSVRKTEPTFTYDPDGDVNGAYSYQLFRGSTAIGSPSATGSLTDTLLLNGTADGPYEYTVQVVDQAGNETTSSPIDVTLDTQAPSTPSTFTEVGTATAMKTRPSFTVGGSTDPGGGPVAYQLLRDGNPVGSPVAAGTITDSTLLLDHSDDGLHHYTVEAVDPATNASAATTPSIDITLDTQAPTTPATFTQVGTATTMNTGPSFTVGGSTDPGGGAVAYQLLRDGNPVGSPVVAGTISDSTLLLDHSADGVHHYAVKAVDAATNTSLATTPTIDITLDTRAPSTPSTFTQVGTATTMNTGPSFTVGGSTDPGGGPVQYQLLRDGNPVGVPVAAGTITDSTLLLDGSVDGLHQYTVEAVDPATNASGATTPSIDITLDTQAPTTPSTFTEVGTATTMNTRPSFTVGGSTDPGGGTVRYQLLRDGNPVGSSVLAGTLSDSTLLLNHSADGLHQYAVEAVDAGTNVSLATTPTIDITLDTTAPTTPSTFSLLGSATRINVAPSFTVGGSTDSAGDTVVYQLLRDGTPVGAPVVAGTISDATILLDHSADGLHHYTVEAVDTATNTSAATTPSIDVTLDTIKPTTPTTFTLVGATTQSVGPSFNVSGSTDANGGSVKYQLLRDGNPVGSPVATSTITDSTIPLDHSADGLHHYRVEAIDSATNTSDATTTDVDVTLDTTGPTTPPSFTLVGTATSLNVGPSFNVSGSTDSGAGGVKYQLLRDGNPVGSPVVAGVVTDSTILLDHSADGVHHYTVEAVDSLLNASSPTATSFDVTLDTIKPTTPTTFVLLGPSLRNNPPAFTVGGSTDTGGGSVLYQLYRGVTPVGSPVAAGTVVDTSIHADGSDDGPYTYTLKAVDTATNQSVATSGIGVTVDGTPPTAASLVLVGPATRNTRPQFTANGSTDSSGGTVKYQLYRRVLPSGVFTAVGGLQAAGVIDDPVIAVDGSGDGSYGYMVKPVDPAGNAGTSTTEIDVVLNAGPPSVPQNLRVATTPTRSAPIISWDASTGNPTSYQVSRDGAPIGVAFAPITTFTDSLLALDGSADGPHTYTVVAIDALANASAASAGVSDWLDTSAPAASSALVAASPTASKPALTWPASISGDISGYNVYRSGVLLNGSQLVTGTGFTDTAASDGTYTYTVRAVDKAGNVSPDSIAATVVFDTAAPSAPAVAAVLGKTAGTAELTWGAAVDTGSGVASYQVRRSIANGAAPATAADGTPVCGPLAASVLACTDSGLTPGASYRYSVFAVDGVGHVSVAGSSSAVEPPLAKDTTPPQAPTAVKSVVASGKVTLSWKNPKADVAKVVVVWNATRAPRSSSDGTAAYKGMGTRFTVALAKLPAGKKVHFSVFAFDAAGNASVAASAVVSVPASGPLSVAPGGKLSGSPALSWKSVHGAAYYNVQVFEGNGTTKRVGIAWPLATRYVLPSADLKKGKTYTWYVWPGLGAKAAAKYGALIGKQTFKYLG
jgi:hypothetical protein